MGTTGDGDGDHVISGDGSWTYYHDDPGNVLGGGNVAVTGITLAAPFNTLELTLSRTLDAADCGLLLSQPGGRLWVDFSAGLGTGTITDVGGDPLESLHPQWPEWQPNSQMNSSYWYHDPVQALDCSIL